MNYVVTSQNKRDITAHPGKCRKFWRYETDGDKVIEKTLIEVEKENTFSQSGTVIEKLLPLDVMITREMGDGLRQKLMNRGVFVYQVDDPDMTPDAVVEQFIQANQQS